MKKGYWDQEFKLPYFLHGKEKDPLYKDIFEVYNQLQKKLNEDRHAFCEIGLQMQAREQERLGILRNRLYFEYTLEKDGDWMYIKLTPILTGFSDVDLNMLQKDIDEIESGRFMIVDGRLFLCTKSKTNLTIILDWFNENEGMKLNEDVIEDFENGIVPEVIDSKYRKRGVHRLRKAFELIK